VAVISLSGISRPAPPVAGDKMDEAWWLTSGASTTADWPSAPRSWSRSRLATPTRLDEVESMEIKGRDLIAGVPKTVVVTSDESARRYPSGWVPSWRRYARC